MSALLLALLLLAVGSRFAGTLAGPRDGRALRLVLSWVAGLLALYLVELACDLAGLRWSRWSLGLGLLAVALAAHRFLPRPREAPALASDLGWGDAVALAALAAFALFAPTLWVTTPDWAYHWGLKGQRFFLAGGIDYELLTRPWSASLHPDYPNLLPGLYAATALLAGRFAAPPQMLWSVLFCAALLAAARELLRAEGVDRAARQAVTALLALLVCGFALRQLAAGGADWPLALAFVLALPALLGARDPGLDPAAERQLGLAAALAAASKIEGVALAAILVAVYAVFRGRRLRPATLARTALLPLAVGLPWLVQALRHDLFLDYDAGGPSLRHAGAVGAALVEALGRREWSGLAVAALLPLPLLFALRARAFAVAAILQLGFYGYVYLSALSDQRFYVLSTFPRLALHVLPAALVAAAAAWLRERPR